MRSDVFGRSITVALGSIALLCFAVASMRMARVGVPESKHRHEGLAARLDEPAPSFAKAATPVPANQVLNSSRPGPENAVARAAVADDRFPGFDDESKIALLYRVGIYSANRKKMTELAQCADAIALVRRETPEESVLRGLMASDSGQTDRAIEIFSKALQRFPRHARLLNLRGRSYSESGNTDLARADFERALGAVRGEQLVARLRLQTAALNHDWVRTLQLTWTIENLRELNCRVDWDMAELYTDSGEQNKAIALLTEAIEIGEGFDLTEPLLLRGSLYGRVGKFDEAIADYGKAMHGNARDLDALTGRAGAYLCKKDFAKARADIDSALTLNPASPDGRYLRARLLNIEGDHRRALWEIEDVEDSLPGHIDVLLVKCDAYYGLSDFHNLIFACRQALALDPNRANLHSNLGFALWRNHEHAAALSEFDRAVAAEPGSAMILANRAICRYESHDDEGSAADLDRVIELRPDAPHYHWMKASIAEARGDFDQANAEYDRLVASSPTNVVYIASRINCRLAQGNLSGANQDARRIIMLDPKLALSYRALALAKSKMHQPDEALANLAKARELDSEPNALLRTSAIVYLALGDFKSAIKKYDEMIDAIDHQLNLAQRVFPTITEQVTESKEHVTVFIESLLLKRCEVLDGRGSAWLRKGEEAKALDDIDLAVACCKEHSSHLFARAELRFHQRDYSGAARDLAIGLLRAAVEPRDSGLQGFFLMFDHK